MVLFLLKRTFWVIAAVLAALVAIALLYLGGLGNLFLTFAGAGSWTDWSWGPSALQWGGIAAGGFSVLVFAALYLLSALFGGGDSNDDDDVYSDDDPYGVIQYY